MIKGKAIIVINSMQEITKEEDEKLEKICDELHDMGIDVSLSGTSIIAGEAWQPTIIQDRVKEFKKPVIIPTSATQRGR